MTKTYRQIILASRPTGAPTAASFEMRQAPLPEPRDGELLLRTIWLSLDPYMRGRMNAGKSYAPPVEVGAVMAGGTITEVMKSNNPKFQPGDVLVGWTGWQEYAIADGRGMRKIDPSAAPISTGVGVLGMPGMTAFVGMRNIGKPKPGETVVVAAASGAVGSLVGQIAKIEGCRAVGIAGGPGKCRHVVEDLGFDACVDHRSPTFAADLQAACPKGIDVYFENVGGAVWSAVWPLLNPFARVPVCGLIANYNDVAPPAGPDMTPVMMRAVLTNRLTLRGFIVSDFQDQQRDFLETVGSWLREGKIKYREDVVEGLEKAPEALIGLLKGRNFGKLLVRVGADP